MPENETVGLARPRGMCVFLLPFTSEPRLTLDAEVAPDSDHLDSGDEVQIGRKRKVSKAASEKQKMAAKKRAKKRKDDDDDDYEDDEDEYTALSKSLRKNKSINAKSIGSLEKCAKCLKQFTVVRSLVVCGDHPINYDL
jgi:DNA repair protein RAD7